MSEQTAVAESVTSTDVSVTVDPAQLNKPVHPSAQDESSDLHIKLGLANAHAKQAKKEKDDLQRQFDELKAQWPRCRMHNIRRPPELEDQGHSGALRARKRRLNSSKLDCSTKQLLCKSLSLWLKARKSG